MNKGELTKAVKEHTGLTNDQASEAVNAVFETISGAVKEREDVAIAGFGTFHAKTRSARTGRNPATGKEIQIDEKTSAAFKPATALKDI